MRCLILVDEANSLINVIDHHPTDDCSRQDKFLGSIAIYLSIHRTLTFL